MLLVGQEGNQDAVDKLVKAFMREDGELRCILLGERVSGRVFFGRTWLTDFFVRGPLGEISFYG